MENEINKLVVTCHGAAALAGWWDNKDNTPREQAEKICLMHSELSEAMEGVRKDSMDDHLPHRKSVEVEMADALIRICDFAGAYGLDLGAAVVEKMQYNAQRADHKRENRAKAGGKAF